MPMPMVDTTFVSRYPDLRALATVQVLDLAPHSRPLPSLGERIRKAMREYGQPISAADIAALIGTSAENVHAWLSRPLAVRDVRCVGKEKQRARAKAARLWVLCEQPKRACKNRAGIIQD